MAGGLGATAASADGVNLKADYAITLAIFTIGKVDVAARFSATGYSAYISATGYPAYIKGSTTGLGRLVSDSQAELSGDGNIAGTRVVPADYSMRSAEAGLDTAVDMTMRNGTVATVSADPMLVDAPDRVPVTPQTLRSVFDPVSALVVVDDGDGTPEGNTICNRTVPVFDGWVRYDIVLSYKQTTNVTIRGANGYSGPAIVCQARYVPVAGHHQSMQSVQYMSQNQRLEAWMVPVKGTNLMIPFKFIIGTAVGDLSVTARNFVVTADDQQANAR